MMMLMSAPARAHESEIARDGKPWLSNWQLHTEEQEGNRTGGPSRHRATRQRRCRRDQSQSISRGFEGYCTDDADATRQGAGCSLSRREPASSLPAANTKFPCTCRRSSHAPYTLRSSSGRQPLCDTPTGDVLEACELAALSTRLPAPPEVPPKRGLAAAAEAFEPRYDAFVGVEPWDGPLRGAPADACPPPPAPPAQSPSCRTRASATPVHLDNKATRYTRLCRRGSVRACVRACMRACVGTSVLVRAPAATAPSEVRACP